MTDQEATPETLTPDWLREQLERKDGWISDEVWYAAADAWEVTEGLNGVLEIALRRTQDENSRLLEVERAAKQILKDVDAAERFGGTPLSLGPLTAAIAALRRLVEPNKASRT